jgi:hypothetical protein
MIMHKTAALKMFVSFYIYVRIYLKRMLLIFSGLIIEFCASEITLFVAILFSPCVSHLV